GVSSPIKYFRMKPRHSDAVDPDDMFADTRMTFGEHIEDLRTHLLRALYGFLLAFVFAIPLSRPVLDYISAPVIEQMRLFTERYNVAREKETQTKMDAGTIKDLPAIPVVIDIKRSV